MNMSSKAIWSGLVTLIVAAMLLAACGGGTTATPAAGGETPAAPTPTEEKAEQKVTSSGFVCPEPNPRMPVTSKELNLYVWTEYIPPDHIECFELVYGVKVNREEYSANEEMYAKLNAGATNYDLVQPTDYIVQLMIRQGLLQKLDKSKLPVLSTFDPTYLNLDFDPNNEYTVPYQTGTDAIVVNTDVIQDPPKSFADLWKPEFVDAKRMIMLDDSRAIIGATLLTLGYDVNTTDPAQLQEAEARLAELAEGVKIYNSDAVRANLLAGDVDLGITWTGEAFLAQQENPAIQYIYPTEGAILWQDNYAVPKDAPHLDAAYAWINYTMQSDLFWMMLRDFPYSNPNKGTLDYAKNDSTTQVDDGAGGTITPADLYEAYINSPITNTPPEEVKKGHRIADVGDATPLYDEIWTRIKE
ncbi:MAG TPA: spermidine/putrescine ABC transporter substrate-binding protein [Anaerolineae bacterium]|nr:spermidine/putrescine ABC transporter substrate-binding protein [Anaerolineae bacterium]